MLRYDSQTLTAIEDCYDTSGYVYEYSYVLRTVQGSRHSTCHLCIRTRTGLSQCALVRVPA
eukprot:scaffold144649_cov50-Prasinocladus_malaysianus.AAC.1